MRHFSRPQVVIVILISLFLLSFYVWRQWSSTYRQEQLPTPVPMPVVIQVSGDVRAPATYDFQESVSAAQALARAGGLLSGVEADPHWETLQVEHGMRIHVRVDGSGRAHLRLESMPVSSLLVLGVPVDVNRLSAEELALIPGISQRLAERIVAERQRRGGYDRLKELSRVDGVGPRTLERLRKYLVVGERNQQAADSKQLAASGKQ